MGLVDRDDNKSGQNYLTLSLSNSYNLIDHLFTMRSTFVLSLIIELAIFKVFTQDYTGFLGLQASSIIKLMK